MAQAPAARLRYLATTYGGGRLLPEGTARWVGEQWMDWQQTTLLPPMRTVFWQLIRTPPDKQDMAAAQTAHQTTGILGAYAARTSPGGSAPTSDRPPSMHRGCRPGATAALAGKAPGIL